MVIKLEELVYSIRNIYIQLNQGIEDNEIQLSIISYLNQLSDYQVKKGQELYENKNQFLKNHLDKYKEYDENQQILISFNNRDIPISGPGFVGYSVLDANNILSENWMRLEDFDSRKAFDKLRDELFYLRHLNLEEVDVKEIPTIKEITDYITNIPYFNDNFTINQFDDVSISTLEELADGYFQAYANDALNHAANYNKYIHTNKDNINIDTFTYTDYAQLIVGASYIKKLKQKIAYDSFVYQLALDLDTRVFPAKY